MYCTNCGAPVQDKALFCESCGSALAPQRESAAAAAAAAANGFQVQEMPLGTANSATSEICQMPSDGEPTGYAQAAVGAGVGAAAGVGASVPNGSPYGYAQPGSQPGATGQQAYGNPYMGGVACPYNPNIESTDRTLRLAAFVLNLLVTIAFGVCIITLAWMIPMTVHSWRIYKGERNNTVAFGVCSLIFVSTVAGILLLCSKKDA